MKNKIAQRITNSIENNLTTSIRKPNLIETDRGKKIYNNIFQNFNNNNKLYTRDISLGAVFAERLNLAIRNLLKRPVFEKGDGIWIDVLSTITKQYINKIHISSKLTPIHGSLKRNEGYVYNDLKDKRNKVKPKFQVNDLVRTANLRDKHFLKSDTTNWSYKLYKSTEINNDTISSFHIDLIKEIYKEALLKKTNLKMKENRDVMKKVNITYIKSK